jgi:transcriptional regulator with XRE-family HTH domain
MTDLTSTKKKEWAKMLYLKENLSQAEIADRVGITRQSLNRWIKTEKWEEFRTGITLTREEQLKCLYRQIAEMNKVISSRETGARFAMPAEAEVIRKLAEAIKKMETDIGIADIIDVGRRFIEWIRAAVSLDKAKEIILLYDGFQKDSIK